MTFPTLDEAFVARLTNGDPLAEQQFIEHFSHLIHVMLRRRLRSSDDIQDITQETFVRTLRSLRQKPGLEHPEYIGAFVHSVCNNVLMERLRSASRHEHKEAAPEAALNSEVFASDLSGRNAVRRVLEDLSDRDRQLLERVFFGETDQGELCREFQVDSSYLRILLHRAKARFRSAYEEATIRERVE